MLLVALLPLIVSAQVAQAPVRFPDASAVEKAVRALDGGELAVFEEGRSGQRPRVMLAALTKAKPGAVRALLMDPQAYRRAVPAFQRADLVKQTESPRALFVAWELEIPLWNLEGRLWMRSTAEGVDLELVEGDLAPGLFRVTARAMDEGTLLIVAGHSNLREANWAAKRLVARSPLAEPAMTAAAALVLLRALVLEAEGGASDPRRRPRSAPRPPDVASLDGEAAARARAAMATTLPVAVVRSRGDGRLERVEVAVGVRQPPALLLQRLAEPQRWRALPGWRKLEVRPATGADTTATWTVDSRFPFVDFDATWAVATGARLRAQVISGDSRGAVLGWDVLPGATAKSSTAVFLLHPRLETSGYIPRKFVEAEPLLEHGLTLGLAYVDALSLVRATAP